MGSAWSPSWPLTCLCAGARPSQLRTPGAPSQSGFPVECSLTPLFHFLYTVMAPSIYLLVVSPPRSNASAISLGSEWDCRVSQALPTFGERNPIADIPPSHHSSYGMGGETEAQRVGVPCQARPPRGRDSLPRAPTQCVWTRASGYVLQVSWVEVRRGSGVYQPCPRPWSSRWSRLLWVKGLTPHSSPGWGRSVLPARLLSHPPSCKVSTRAMVVLGTLTRSPLSTWELTTSSAVSG